MTFTKSIDEETPTDAADEAPPARWTKGCSGSRPPDAAPEDLADRLAAANDAYEGRFGFRYCVFVAGRPREALLPGMAAALRADRDAEIHRALDAVVDIAMDRAAKARADTIQEAPR